MFLCFYGIGETRVVLRASRWRTNTKFSRKDDCPRHPFRRWRSARRFIKWKTPHRNLTFLVPIFAPRRTVDEVRFLHPGCPLGGTDDEMTGIFLGPDADNKP